MANRILVAPYPYGKDVTQRGVTVSGTIALCGSAVSTGEPLNWAAATTGIGYNEINFAGNGAHGSDTALTTDFAVSAGVCTVQAVNNFSAGQTVSFVGNTQTLSALFNGVTVQIVSATSSAFTFNTALTGTTTTGDVGLAYTQDVVLFGALSGPSLTATVSALSASGTTLTVTAANKFLPGALVTVSVATGTLGPKLTMQVPVLQSTGTAFTAQMPSALTGSTGTGTATASNPPQPFSLKVWSALASGYIYQYNETFGTLFVKDVTATGTVAAPTFTGESYTPAGTVAKPAFTVKTGTILANGNIGLTADTAGADVVGGTGITADRTLTTTSPVGIPAFSGSAHTLAGTNSAPAFTGTAAVLANLAAAAYPAGVLADVIRFEAFFRKDR